MSILTPGVITVFVKDKKGQGVEGAQVSLIYSVAGIQSGRDDKITDQEGKVVIWGDAIQVPLGCHVAITATSGLTRGTASLDLAPFVWMGSVAITLGEDATGVAGDWLNRIVTWVKQNLFTIAFLLVVICAGIYIIKRTTLVQKITAISRNAFDRVKKTAKSTLNV